MSINFYSNNASHNSSTVADTPPNLIKNQDSRLWRGQEKGSKVCESRSQDAVYQILPLIIQ